MLYFFIVFLFFGFFFFFLEKRTAIPNELKVTYKTQAKTGLFQLLIRESNKKNIKIPVYSHEINTNINTTYLFYFIGYIYMFFHT